jgi:glycine/D-amino acid oxidase-like deaminating enzyme
MMRYSLASLVRGALSGHRTWPRAWRDPDPKPAYEVVIIGGGGHGLATANYLARDHGITDVAVLEKGWLGGGNTGRNTTIVRRDRPDRRPPAPVRRASDLPPLVFGYALDFLDWLTANAAEFGYGIEAS